MNNKTAKVAALFSILFLILNCTEKTNIHKNNKPVTIKFQAGQLEHKPWDPEASYSVQINFNSAVFSSPIEIDRNYNLKPKIFKSWKWNAQRNSFIFTIDNDLSYDENRKLKIEDIEFAIIKNFLSEYGSYKRNYFYDIKGIESLEVGMKYFSGMCAGIKILNSESLEIILNKPNPNFIYTLQDGIPPIAPIEDFTDDYFTFKDIPRGLGNFKISYNHPKTSLVELTRKINENDSLSNVSKILFFNHGKPIENQVDLAVDSGGAGLSADNSYQIHYGNIPKSIHVVSFNFTNPLANNILFRQAISLSLDREKIFSEYKQTKENHELIPSVYLGRSGKKFDYDPEKAKVIIAQLKKANLIKEPLNAEIFQKVGD